MSRRPGALRSLGHGSLAAWLLASLVATPPWLPAAQAAPKGEKVVKGKATFTRDGDVTVIRTGKRAIIEFEGFDILSNETVRFEQPNRKSRVLNRVSGDATRIDGKLQGNGIVYIVNPQGVFFGRTAVVDVKRLVAAAGDLPDRKFLQQVDQFSLTGPVENLGAIDAQSVALLGTSVANHGSIVAPDGVIALVAGDRVVLTRLEGGISIEVDGPPQGAEPGVQQTGLVDATGGRALFAVGDHYSLAINHTGVTRARDIRVAGGDGGLVKVAGQLDASAPAPGAKGGSVRVTGELVQLEGALLDASGAAGGGDIRVGGDLRGRGPMRNARRTVVDADSTLRADALAQGDGGSAVVYGDEAAGFFGEISARGGAAGGDGGFAELSSEGTLVDEGSADLGASAGKAGTLLYDPQDIVIEGGTDDGNDLPDTDPGNLQEGTRSAGTILFADAASLVGPFVIHESEIEQTNANIVLEARNSITATGTFDHNSGANEGAGVVVVQSGNDLTMRTRNNGAVPPSGSNPGVPADDQGSSVAPGIYLTDSAHGANLEWRASDGGTIEMQTGTGDVNGPEAAIEVGILTTQGGRVSLATEDGSVTVNSVTTNDLDGAANGVRAGDIEIGGGDKDASGDSDVLVTGNLTARGGSGTTGRGGNGGFIGVGSGALVATAGGGDTTVMGNIDASGGDGPEAAGIGNNVFVGVTVTGNLSVGNITTRGGSSTNGNGGNGGQATLRTGSGNISAGAIDTSGGETQSSETQVVGAEDVPRFRGGNGGGILMTAGTEKIATGSITLNGNLVSLGGASPLEDGEGFGNVVELRAKGSIEHAGQAGPHITTGGNDANCRAFRCGSVIFNAADVGALSPIIVDGGDSPEGLLGLGADNIARVVIQNEKTFDDIQVLAYTNTGDIQIVEAGDEIVRLQNAALVHADTTENKAELTIAREDRLTGADDVDGITLSLLTNSLRAGGNVRVLSEDDIVIGDSAGTVAVMNTRPADPPDPDAPPPTEPVPTRSGVLFIRADSDEDNVGKVTDGVAGVATGALNLRGDAQEAGGLIIEARNGIGEPGNPIGTVGVTTPEEDMISDKIPVALQNAPRTPTVAMPTPLASSGGIYLRNDGGGELTSSAIGFTQKSGSFFGLAGVNVVGGPGDVELENAAGDLVLERTVGTTGTTLGPDPGQGGDVTLRANPATGAVTLATEFVSAVDAAGNVVLDGPVHLNQNSIVLSRGGDVDFNGSVDTDPLREDRSRSLIVRANEVSGTSPNQTRGKITLAGDVGATNQLRTALFDGDVVLEGGPRVFRLTNTLAFLGKIDAVSQDGASLAIQAGPLVEFSGSIGAGENGRLGGLSIVRNDDPAFASQPDPRVLFGGDSDQQVQTGAGGISFPELAEIPESAMVGKIRGGLTLQSTGGDVIFGQNQKLTAQGDVMLTGNNVQIGDVSALTIDVNASNEARILTRVPSGVLLRSGGTARDEGTDLVANEVTFSNAAPTLVGPGSVRVITPDGTSTNTAGLVPVAFQRDVTTGDMLRGPTVLDLTSLPSDFPNEVPQRGPVIDGLVPLRRSDESASGSALPPGAEQTLAYLRCAASQPRDTCDVVPASPLDSPRGAELAADATQFLGDSPEARARREALARLEPGALRELAVFLTEIRLLGLSEAEYQAVRDGLYREILAGSVVAPDANALARAVNGQSRGVPL